MKQGWEIKRLGDVCNVLNGLWIGKKEPFINICVIRNTNFTKDCKLNLDNVAYIDAEAKQFASRKLLVGDIIVEKSGGSEKQPVGRVVLFDIVGGDYSFSNFTSALRVKDGVDVIPKYLHRCLYAHYLRGETYKLQSKTTGLHNLDMKGYLRLPIPVPPIAEQEKIVAELDCLSGIIEKKKQQLKELDALAQSIFYEMFGDPVENDKRWDVKRIEDICDVYRGGSPRPIDKFLGGNIPWIKIGDATLGDSIFLTQTKEHIIEEGLRKTRFIHSGSLIFANCGVSLGFARIITFDGCIHDGWLAFDNVSEEIDKIFFLKSLNFCTPYFRSIAPDGVQPNLNTSIMKAFKQILPPLSMQKDYVDKIQAIEKQKLLITESLVQAEMLLNSRMDYYFN